MRKAFLASAILVGVLTAGGPRAGAQEPQHRAPRFQWSSTDLAITYATEQTNVTPGTGKFWLQGGGADAAVTFSRGIGVAMSVTGGYASNFAPGVSLAEVAVLVGPRYTLRVPALHKSRVFVEALAGGVRGFNGVFPEPTGLATQATSFAMQVGGGWDIGISKHLAIRAIEADYVRTYLPNNGTNTQDHLRLAFGVTYHIQRH